MTSIFIVGAGPYGLSAAAHLRAAGTEVTVIGDPMSFWSGNMPSGMLLRSPRVASSISDPEGKLDLDGYTSATGSAVGSPVPLRSFVEYGRWFQSKVVPDIDRRRVERIDRDGERFLLALADGDIVPADRVIVAAGIAPFAYIPPVLADFVGRGVSHVSSHSNLAAFSGQRVLVVGGGQSALESAALLHENGAEVDVVVRAPGVRWLGQRPWLRSMGPVSKLLYAPPEVGPPLLSQLVRAPGAVRLLPPRPRKALDRRSIRPAGAGWLRSRVDGAVPVRLSKVVKRAESTGNGLTVTFEDGGREAFDQVIVGTGYRVDLQRYPFLSSGLLGVIRRVNGYPVLGPGFESSVPGLHFLGAPGAWSYGPLMRFVAGTTFAGREVSRFVTSSATRPAWGSTVRT